MPYPDEDCPHDRTSVQLLGRAPLRCRACYADTLATLGVSEERAGYYLHGLPRAAPPPPPAPASPFAEGWA